MTRDDTDIADVLIAWIAKDPARASDRYKLLVRQMKAELDGRYGWRAQVARRLGVSGSHVGKIDDGDLGTVSPKVIARAMERLGLTLDFFLSDRDEEPHYRRFLRGNPGSPAAAIAARAKDHLGWVFVVSRAQELLRTLAQGEAPPAEQVRALGRRVRALRAVQLAEEVCGTPDPYIVQSLAATLSAAVLDLQRDIIDSVRSRSSDDS